MPEENTSWVSGYGTIPRASEPSPSWTKKAVTAPWVMESVMWIQGRLLHISKGALYQAEILGIQKGKSGSPGELSGLIRYEPGQIIGAVDTNSKNGYLRFFL